MKFSQLHICISLFFCTTISAQPESDLTLAFGSCNKETLPQNYWEVIAEQNPDMWIWLGDNIYGDSYDTAALSAKYAMQKSNPYYKNFLQTVPVVGTWDDHDYGWNDAGKDFAMKDASKELFMRFFDIASDDVMRKRGGVYHAVTIEKKGIAVKIILLDTRYFRDTLIAEFKDKKKVYLPNTTGDVLGEEQWIWLENELQNSKADVHIICSSIQVIAEEHCFEKWSNFPTARQRLLNLIANNHSVPVIILSGDRHIAEVSEIALPDRFESVVEITSSGLTHTWSQAGEESNVHRISDLYMQKNFGLLQFSRDKKQLHVVAQLFTTEGILLFETIVIVH